MIELIEQLPEFAAFHQLFHPAITNWLPFFWRGFEQTTSYTYRIEDTSDVKKLWSETRENVRTDVKKAQKLVKVDDSADLESFLRLHWLTFSRQGKAPPHSEAALRAMDRACAGQNARKILVAKGDNGEAHAGAYLVSDQQCVYYLLGGGDPKLRNSGATSLVIWEAIRWASEQGKSFDFEGSTVESIERFVRAFGGRQTPVFQIRKMPSKIVWLYRFLHRQARALRR
jgi:lipid II:glycine glycyltransferase (peptidoglycan interpeptide bridge formation enzyme)